MTQSRFVTVKELAAVAEISLSTAYRWLETGEIPQARKVGGGWFIRREVVEEMFGVEECSSAREKAGR